MANILRCQNNSELIDIVKQSDHPFEVIAKTIYDLEIISVHVGGSKEPAILITAGAHAGEPAGVLAALSLITSIKTDHSVYIVPLRDPFAWGGYSRCLSYLLGFDVLIETHEDAEYILRNFGTVIFFEEDDHLIISLIGDVIFVSMRPSKFTVGPREIEKRLNIVFQEKPELVPILSGKRTCWPTNLQDIEGCGNFDRAFSGYVTQHGLIADFNRQFTYAYPPIEVGALRSFVDQIKPGLIFDLHEGQGSKFYLWTNKYEEGTLGQRIAYSILNTLAEHGDDLYSLEELSQRIGTEKANRLQEPIPGLVVGPPYDIRQGASFDVYCHRYGNAFTFEPGRWKSLDKRVDQVIRGALAGIREFENNW